MVAAAALVGSLAGAGSAYVVSSATGGETTTVVAATGASTAGVTSSDGASTTQAALAAVQDSVVTVHATVTQRAGRMTQTGQATGTGIVYGSDGIVITNAHVVEGATTVTVVLPGETLERTATVLGADTSADVAVLQVEGVSDLTPATFGTSDSIEVGEDVIAVGNALALEGDPSVTRGIISGLDRTLEFESGTTLTGLVQTDAAISSGDSGGPLVDAEGRVIGMDTAGASGTSSTTVENMGFAIPVDQLLAVAEQLLGGST